MNSVNSGIISIVTLDDVERNKSLGFPDLSAQRKQFARHYLESYNPKKAAKESGLPMTQAHLILQEPLVSAFVDYLQTQYNERSFLSREMVLLEQIDLLDKVMGREDVPMVGRDGSSFNAKCFHASEAVKLVSDLAKQTGAAKASGGAGSGVIVNINLGNLGLAPIEVAGETLEHGN